MKNMKKKALYIIAILTMFSVGILILLFYPNQTKLLFGGLNNKHDTIGHQHFFKRHLILIIQDTNGNVIEEISGAAGYQTGCQVQTGNTTFSASSDYLKNCTNIFAQGSNWNGARTTATITSQTSTSVSVAETFDSTGCYGSTTGLVDLPVYVYATLAVASHTLTVNPNGGTWNGSTSSQTFTLNEGATKTISNPTRSGYTFGGWTRSGTGSSMSGTTFTMGTANATLTAKWTANSYAITLDKNGGTGGTSTVYHIPGTGPAKNSTGTTKMTTSTNAITTPTRSQNIKEKLL